MPGSPTPPVVLHILPYDLARGAQRYARALVDALNAEGEAHQILTLFRADPVLLRPDVELDVPAGCSAVSALIREWSGGSAAR